MKKWNRMIFTDFLLILLLLSIGSSFILAFVSIIIHEAAHIIIAKLNGCEMSRFKVNFFGVNAVLADIDEITPEEKIEIYLAGPIINIVIVIMCLSLQRNYNSEIIHTLLNINLGLAIFNLMPAYPLDGARVLEVILSKKILYTKAHYIVCITSYCVAMIFIVVNTITQIEFRNNNITLLIGALVIIYYTREERKASTYIAMGNIFKKRNSLRRNKYIENKSISIYYKLEMVNLMKVLDKNKFNYFFILDDNFKVIFTMGEDELIEALKLYGNITLEEYYKVRK